MLIPGTVLKLQKLWPHARKQGREIGQIWRVGYYSKKDGLGVIWLVNHCGEYCWTADKEFIDERFSIIFTPKNKSIYGVGKKPLGLYQEGSVKNGM